MAAGFLSRAAVGRSRAGVPAALALAAGPDRPAGAAEVAAVLADDGVVAAFAAARALHHRRLLVGARRFEDAHLARGIAALVEDAQHRVAMDHEAREVRDGGRPVLLAPLPRHEGHEVAQGLGIV